MKQLGNFLLNLGREASEFHGYTQSKICRYPLTVLGLQEAISEKKVLAFLRLLYNPGKGSNLDLRIRSGHQTLVFTGTPPIT